MRELTLRKIREEEFFAFVSWLMDDYAGGLAKKEGLTRDEAAAKARQETYALIPDGRYDEALHIYVAVNAQGEDVGHLWYLLMEEETLAFVADIAIHERHRRKGYGRQLMLRMEEEARRHGLYTIALHVFEHNAPARALYEALGYEVVAAEPGSINMRKTLV